LEFRRVLFRSAFSARIARMFIGRRAAAIPFAFLSAVVFASETAVPQSPPAASGARILLLPRRIVSGERATLAVLDVDGRLTPGVTVNFSNGDRSEEHTSELQSRFDLVCRLLLEKKK